MGRPKQDVVKEKIVGIRFSEKEYNRLKEYADMHSITITDVVYKGLEKVYSEEN